MDLRKVSVRVDAGADDGGGLEDHIMIPPGCSIQERMKILISQVLFSSCSVALGIFRGIVRSEITNPQVETVQPTCISRSRG